MTFPTLKDSSSTTRKQVELKIDRGSRNRNEWKNPSQKNQENWLDRFVWRTSLAGFSFSNSEFLVHLPRQCLDVLLGGHNTLWSKPDKRAQTQNDRKPWVAIKSPKHEKQQEGRARIHKTNLINYSWKQVYTPRSSLHPSSSLLHIRIRGCLSSLRLIS